MNASARHGIAAAMAATRLFPPRTSGGQAQAPSGQQHAAEAPPLGPNQWRHRRESFGRQLQRVPPDGVHRQGPLGRITGTLEYDGKDVRSIKATSRFTSLRDHAERSLTITSAAPTFSTSPITRRFTFKSPRVEPRIRRTLQADGDLTIRGTKKEVALDVRDSIDARQDRRGGLFTGRRTHQNQRLEYGVKFNNMVRGGPFVSDELTITSTRSEPSHGAGHGTVTARSVRIASMY